MRASGLGTFCKTVASTPRLNLTCCYMFFLVKTRFSYKSYNVRSSHIPAMKWSSSDDYQYVTPAKFFFQIIIKSLGLSDSCLGWSVWLRICIAWNATILTIFAWLFHMFTRFPVFPSVSFYDPARFSVPAVGKE